MKGRPFDKKLAVIGGSVWYLLPQSLGTDKLDERWCSGIWCGILDESGEYLMGTMHGIIKARTFRRRPSGERWNTQEVKDLAGTSLHPYPGDNKFTFKDIKPNVRFTKEPEIPPADTGTEKEPRRPRFFVTKADRH